MRSKLCVIVISAVLVASCSSRDEPAALTLPGDAVFPEGVAVDEQTGAVYAGSARDGAVYRATSTSAPFELFLSPGGDGRTEATGVKVGPGRRLFVAGRRTGRLFVHDLASGRLVARRTAPGAGRTLVNDLTFTGGAAYVTDSFRPFVYRLPVDGEGGEDSEVGELEPWLDLRGTLVPSGSGFGLNGISASDDGRHLLTVHFDSGRLFRIDVRTREVLEVDLKGDLLRTGDGLLLEGRTLLAVRERPGDVVPVRLSPDLLSGELGRPFGGDAGLRLPTTLARLDGTVLVVESQLDREPGQVELPFRVVPLPLPGSALRTRRPASGGA